ncbi:DUF7519 family protein [Halobacterium yunchengense]|uniref:DUF7519 family protein n=1 Tax=Halobacterium yunchengense TaxID=3108497 RepID=UPI00300928A4
MSAATVRRPTLLSGAALVAVVAFAANDATAAYGGLALVAAVGGGLLAVSTGLATRDEPAAVFAASVLAPAGGAAVFAAMGLSVADFPLLEGVLDPVVLLGVAAGGFGAAAAFTGGVGGGAVGRAFSVVVATTVLPFLAAVAALVSQLGAGTGLLGRVPGVARLLADLVVSPTGGPVDVVVFVVVIAATARALAAGVDAAPLVELAPREHRLRVARASRYAVAVCLSVWRLAALSWTLVFVGFVAGLSRSVVEGVPDPLVALVGALASSGPVRVLALAAIAASVLVVVALKSARLVAGDHRESLRRVAPTAAGGVLAVAFGVAFADRVVARARRALPETARPALDDAAAAFGDPVLALAGLLAPLAGLAALLLLFAGLGRLRAVPQRGAPAAVAAAGLVLAAAAAGVQDAPREFVFGLVAAGMVAWDVGEYGVGLAAELDRGAPTTRAELVHAAAAVGVGALAYYGALFVHDLTRGAAAPSTGAALAVLVAGGVGLAALVGALAE